VLAVFLSFALSFCGSGDSNADEIQPATDRPKPKSPQESSACVQMPPGFVLELVAAEPLVKEPTAMAFDERGGIFVCEIHGYNLDGYLDIVELNKTGKLDREVRRVRHATPVAQAAAGKETYGTLKLLHDTDGDGRADAADVWADRLPPCHGVIAARGGAIVVCAPDIVYLADRDGDGVAETRETLFTGFAREYIERGINNPRWGLDNWIYVAAGGGGGTVAGPGLTRPVTIGHTDFRFKPDGSAIEPVTGTERMFGLAFNDFGDRFHTVVAYSAPLAYRYLARNPFVESPAGDVSIMPSRRLFPISEPDPWRQARGQDPAWVDFYGAAETQPNGQFTASCGQMIYRADALPEPYRGNFFVCDPANNLIHRVVLERDGAAYTARRAPEDEASEFLASTDQWFRPINLSVGPDGAIYIVDMYREIIEDFSAIPRFLQQQYAEGLVAGSEFGRIWRLSCPASETVAPRPAVRLDTVATSRLVDVLDHPNHWQRETAQRLLVERGGGSSRPALAGATRHAKTPQGRVHALYALDGLGLLEADDVAQALRDADAAVRMHALELADRWLDDDSELFERVLQLTDDDDPRVRIQLALTLGESRQERAAQALARLAIEHGGEAWMPAAVVSSLTQSTDAFLTRLLADETAGSGALTLLGPVAETIGGLRDEELVGRLLHRAADLAGIDFEKSQRALLDGLIQGLERGASATPARDEVTRGLEKLLMSSSPEVSQQAIRLAGLLKVGDSPRMRAVWERAALTALDVDQPLAGRLEAVALLSAAPWARQKPLAALLDSREPAELQLAAVRALASSDHEEVAEALLENLAGLVPQVQESIIDACFARDDRLPRLLKTIENRIVPAVALGALRREQLVEHRESAVREQARELLAALGDAQRAGVVRKYESALTLSRDPRRGEAVFTKTCAKCHRLGQRGVEVGPDLAAARTRPDATLLVDILDPSSALARGYTVYAVATTDGRVYTGLLARETATSITLRSAGQPAAAGGVEGVEENTILGKDIDEMRTLSKSLMPDGLENELTPQDVADLIGFVRHSIP
jgi:putative membrane-bound dehydrogenase-like protein